MVAIYLLGDKLKKNSALALFEILCKINSFKKLLQVILLPILLGVAITFCMVQIVEINENKLFFDKAYAKSQNIVSEIKTSLINEVTAISRMSYRLSNEVNFSEKNWLLDAKALQNNIKSLKSIKIIDKDIDTEDLRYETIKKVISTGYSQATHVINFPQGAKGFYIISPIIKGGNIDGFVSAEVDVTTSVKGGGVRRDENYYQILITENGKQVYPDFKSKFDEPNFISSRSLRYSNLDLNVTVGLTSFYADVLRAERTKLIYPFGIILTVLFFIISCFYHSLKKELSIKELNEKEIKNYIDELLYLRRSIDEHSIVSITDADGIITYVNDTFINVSGYDREALVGKNHRIINSGWHSKEFFEDLWKTISSGNIWKGKIKNSKKNGDIYWLQTTIVPLMDARGRPKQYTSIRTDVTDDILYDEKLLIARNQAVAANKSKATFIASMSHELRTPLNAIIGFSDIMHQQVFGPIANSKYLEYAEDINVSGKTLLTMIDDILDISRLESQKLKFKLEEYDIIEFSKSIIRRFDGIATKKEISIKVKPDNEKPLILWADQKLQIHITNNFVSNAIKHVDDYEGKIIVEIYASNDNELILSVSDNGEGMSANMIAKIGKPFLLEDEAYNSKGEKVGNGLGLYITKNMIEQSGGKLIMESELGVGTTAKAVWPISVFEKHETSNKPREAN